MYSRVLFLSPRIQSGMILCVAVLFLALSPGKGWAQPTPTPTPASYDFGDAPDPPYPTLLSSNGARHIIWEDLYLGLGVDGEPDGQPLYPAHGDDYDGNDDEFGVKFPAPELFKAGDTIQYEVIASGAGYLNAWMDRNTDGDWTDPDEQIVIDMVTVAGSNTLSVEVDGDGCFRPVLVRCLEPGIL
jgi:hypothetical protein